MDLREYHAYDCLADSITSGRDSQIENRGGEGGGIFEAVNTLDSNHDNSCVTFYSRDDPRLEFHRTH